MSAAAAYVAFSQLQSLARVGEALPFRVFDAQGRLLLGAGQRLTSREQFEALVERGAQVLANELRQAQAAADAGSAATKPAHRTTLFDRWEQQIWSLDTLLRALARGEADPARLHAMVDGFTALVDADADVALFHLVHPPYDRYALYAQAHALHTASIVRLVGRALGWEAPRVASVVGAALTMNTAIVELQATLAEQKDKPSQKQLDLIRAHPTRADALLGAAGLDDALWLDTVLDHHEQPGGRGYPRGKSALSEEAQLLRAADVYAAKISARAFRAPLTPQVAAAQLYQDNPGSVLAATLIRTLGVHPPGQLVKLKSGEVGIVTRRAADGRGATVATLTDAQGRPHSATHARDSAQPTHAITGTVSRDSVKRVLPERVYGLIEG